MFVYDNTEPGFDDETVRARYFRRSSEAGLVTRRGFLKAALS